MKKNFKKKDLKIFILFLVIFLVGIFTRFYNIDKIPPFAPHDELGYFINAKALQLSGSDITGTWSPLSLKPVTADLAELTTQIIFPFYLFPVDIFLAGKLPFLLMSLLLPFFIAGITHELTQSKNTALFAWLFSLFNPWIWQIGRMPFDGYASFFFYIVGGYLLLRLKKWQKLWSLLPLFVGFYQYQGHKLVFPFWVLAFSLYSAKKFIIKKTVIKEILPQLTVLFFSLFLFIFYILIQLPNHQSKNRLNSLFKPNSSEIAQIVNDQRRLSIYSPLTNIFINKYTIWTAEVFERFVETYSFNFLFLEGQANNSSWSVWNHGIFYVFDSVLIVFGFIYLIISKKYKLIIFFSFLLLTSVIPSLISAGRSYFFRSSLNIPLLIIIAAIGAEYSRKISPKLIKNILILVYVFSVFHFAYLYFVRYPIVSSDRQFFSDRILSEYLRRIPKYQKTIIFTPEPEFTVSTYLFFNNILNEDNISVIQNAYRNKEFVIDNIRFTNNCFQKNYLNFDDLIVSRYDIKICDTDGSYESTEINSLLSSSEQIQAIQDSGTYFNIYNDKLCSGFNLNRYLRINNLNQFDFKKMTDEEFCQTWILD